MKSLIFYFKSKNISRSQMVASNTSHWFLRCQVVLNKRHLSEIVLLHRIWAFEFCHNFSCWVVEFCHSLSFWNLSYFELNFVQIQGSQFCYNSSFLTFVTILVFEFCNNLSCWVFFTILVMDFFHNFSLHFFPHNLSSSVL